VVNVIYTRLFFVIHDKKRPKVNKALATYKYTEHTWHNLMFRLLFDNDFVSDQFPSRRSLMSYV
jgi:hypothetical protein